MVLQIRMLATLFGRCSVFFGQNLHVPWIVVGECSAIFFSHERSSGNLAFGNKDRAFGDLVLNIGMVDIGFSEAFV